jgi:hypothetical protein
MKDVDSSPLGAAFENFCNKTSGERRKIPGSGRISLLESSGGLGQQRFDDARPTWQNFFCFMYDFSLRHLVWVAEINVTSGNSVCFF